MTIAVFTLSLLGAMALGMPIAFALIVCGVALMDQLDIFDSQIVAQNIINGADSFPLMAVPFFMLAGEIMNTGGLSRRIVNVALAFVGHVRGGLGYVAIMAACILSALSGSAVADAAALSALLIPMMTKAGHDKATSGGLIAAAGIIGPVIPPSIGFVIFGVVGGVSITKLFLAGIIPGILIAISLCCAWWWQVRKTIERLMRDKAVACGEVWRAADPLEFPISMEERLRGGDRKIEMCLLVETLRTPEAEEIAVALAKEFPSAEIEVYRLLCEITATGRP